MNTKQNSSQFHTTSRSQFSKSLRNTFNKTYTSGLNHSSPSNFNKTAQLKLSSYEKQLFAKRELNKQLNDELKEINQEKMPYCTYINSFRINEELQKICYNPCEIEQENGRKCIKKLIDMHMCRLNMKTSRGNTRGILKYRSPISIHFYI